MTVTKLTGKAHADAPAATLHDPLLEELNQSVGRTGVRRGPPSHAANHHPEVVDVRKFDVRGANVDREDLLLEQERLICHGEIVVTADERLGHVGGDRATRVVGVRERPPDPRRPPAPYRAVVAEAGTLGASGRLSTNSGR